MTEERDEQFNPDNLPTTITRTLYVRYGMGKYNSGKISVDEHNLQSDCFAAILLHELSITIDIPPQDREAITVKALAVLEDEKASVLAENYQRLRVVQDKIDNLLAIEFKPAA